MYCLFLSSLFIVSGCATSGKQKRILNVQQRRIQSLEKELVRKQRVISKLKANRWAKKPVKKSIKLAIRPLVKAVKKKDWVRALKLSSKLKEEYPRNKLLARYRYSIFKKMGLEKQAIAERNRYKKLQAVAPRSRRTR